MQEIIKVMNEAASYIQTLSHVMGEHAVSKKLREAAFKLEEELQNQAQKLAFMVEMTKLDHDIEMNNMGEFKSELTNAMFVGWMAKVNKENK